MRRLTAMILGGGARRGAAVTPPADPEAQRLIDRALAQIDAIVSTRSDGDDRPAGRGKSGAVGAAAALAMMLVAAVIVVNPLPRPAAAPTVARVAIIDVPPPHRSATAPLPTPLVAPAAPGELADLQPSALPQPRATLPAPAHAHHPLDLSATLAALPPDPQSAPGSAPPSDDPSGNGKVARHLTGEAQRLALIADAQNTRALNRRQLGAADGRPAGR